MTHDAAQRTGMLAAVTAFLIWGTFPLYWKQLAAVPALEIVAHRTAWAFVAVGLWVTWRREWGPVRALAGSARTVLTLAASAVLIAANWGIYVWAVNHGQIVESSLGYYINPLVNVVLGVVLLHERLGRARRLAVALAAVGVAIMTIAYGRFPWISLALALTFGFYGLLRKRVAADAVHGLLYETAILTPLAAGYLAWLAWHGSGALGRIGTRVDALLVLAGAVTAVPLALFTVGARNLPLSTLGMFQYISPTCQFLIAVLLYREPFGAARAAAFACIWAALAVLTWDIRRRLRAIPRPAPGDMLETP